MRMYYSIMLFLIILGCHGLYSMKPPSILRDTNSSEEVVVALGSLPDKSVLKSVSDIHVFVNKQRAAVAPSILRGAESADIADQLDQINLNVHITPEALATFLYQHCTGNQSVEPHETVVQNVAAAHENQSDLYKMIQRLVLQEVHKIQTGSTVKNEDDGRSTLTQFFTNALTQAHNQTSLESDQHAAAAQRNLWLAIAGGILTVLGNIGWPIITALISSAFHTSGGPAAANSTIT